MRRILIGNCSPMSAGIRTIIDHLAKTRPEAKGLKSNDFIDSSILKRD